MSQNPITGREEIPEFSVGSSPVPASGWRFDRKIVMAETDEGAHFPFQSLTSKDTLMDIHCVRGSSDDVTQDARTSWDGNPDQIFNYRNRNYAANASSVGAIRTGMIQCQNRSGGIIHWMRGLDIELDNRGTVSDAAKALRIGVRNNSSVTGDVVGLEIELLGQSSLQADVIALDLVHNDDSAVTKPIGLNFRGDASSDGFAFLFRVEANGLQTDGASVATSAVMKIADDGENADLASAVSTVNGVLKVVIGTTVCYIPTYASYTPS